MFLIIILTILLSFTDTYSMDTYKVGYKEKVYRNPETINQYMDDYDEILDRLNYVEIPLFTETHDINNIFFYIGKRKINLIYAAAIANSKDRIERFKCLGANINIKDENGRTPLINAAKDQHHKAAYLLISCGADYTIKDRDGKDFFDYAPEPFNYLRNQGISNKDLINMYKKIVLNTDTCEMDKE